MIVGNTVLKDDYDPFSIDRNLRFIDPETGMRIVREDPSGLKLLESVVQDKQPYQPHNLQLVDYNQATDRKYKIILEQITPHNTQDLGAISAHLLKSLNQGGFISDEDYREALANGEREVKQNDNQVFASHPVYRATIVAENARGVETLADVVIKMGDNPNEAKAYEFFSQFDDIKSPELVFNNRVLVDGKYQNMIATQFIEGENLTEMCQRQDEKLFKYSWDAVAQLARIQERGTALDLEDVVAKDKNYFSGRVDSTFIKKFKDIGYKAGWLNDNDVKDIDSLQKVILGNYSRVNKLLAEDSQVNPAMYVDFSPMNIRVAGDDVYSIDLAGDRKLTGMLSFVSLTEFGKKYLSDSDLENGHTEYYTEAQKKSLFYRWLSERQFEKTGNYKLSGEEFAKADMLRKYAALQRHLEYTGYASRDMNECENQAVLRNEFNRQRYHMRTAMKYVKDILNTDRNLVGAERLEMLNLANALKRMNNIVERQAIKSNAIYL